MLGGGGREHALCWRLAACPSVEEVLCAPGNPGIAQVAALRDVDPADPAAVVALTRAEPIDLVVIGPEAPLVAGVADALAAAGVPVFGPSAAAARIEASKSFAKEVMAAAGVPTAEHVATDEVAAALAALERFGPPYVVKADGLAAGKGVVVTVDRAAAEAAVRAALEEGAFGEAGRAVVVERYLAGPEVSVFAVCDGVTALPLGVARDHKRLADGDSGPNTGGMGAFSPVGDAPPDLAAWTLEHVVRPVLAELDRRETPFTGVLYTGLVLTADGPVVLEFNARLGDPEAQVLLPRLRGDLAALLATAAHGELAGVGPPEEAEGACVAIVLATPGYPAAPVIGAAITGLDDVGDDVLVFHAGTRREGEAVVTAGGRVLAVAARGATVAEARDRAAAGADRIAFPGVQRRTDIATRAG